MILTSLAEQLKHYGSLGYQIVFDDWGIRVWYRFACPTVKLYEGDLMHDALCAIEEHWDTLEEE